MSLKQKILLAIWIAAIAAGLGTYLIHPEWFDIDHLKHFIESYKHYMLLVFFLVSVGRGIFLIPSTPFILAGAAIFPNDLIWVFVISMMGVVSGSAIIYYFTEFLGLDKVLEKRFSKKMEKVAKGMDKYGFWVVVGWSFFPVVPTDLVAYVAGLTRMKPWKFFLGVIIGELPLVALYVFTGQALGDFLF